MQDNSKIKSKTHKIILVHSNLSHIQSS